MVRASDRTPEQTRSKQAFGHDHFLAVAQALLRRSADLSDKEQIMRETGVPATSVYNALNRMRDLGVLTEVVDGNRLVYVAVDPEEGSFWRFVRDLLLSTTSAPNRPGQMRESDARRAAHGGEIL